MMPACRMLMMVRLLQVGQWWKDLLVKQMARRPGRVGQALAVPQRWKNLVVRKVP